MTGIDADSKYLSYSIKFWSIRKISDLFLFSFLFNTYKHTFMSRSLNSLSKFVRPQSDIVRPSSFLPSQLLPRNISLRYTRTCVRPGPLLVVPTACVPLRSGFGNVRHYANFPGGFPQGFPGLGQQQQKGDALKEYVCCFYVFFLPWI
jgi:hypothetical protein